MANNAYLCNICAVTVVLWQKGNPQAIQPLHLPAWTEFPYSCLLTGVKQVLGWETSWEIQLLQAQTNEREAEMGSHSCLTTTEGIWQRVVLTFYFNSSRPMKEKSKQAKGGGRQDIPHPPIWTSDTSCLECRTNTAAQVGHPRVHRLSCLPLALLWPFLILRGCLKGISSSPAHR